MDIQQQESLDLTFTAGQCKLARCTVEQLLKAAVLECIAKEDAVEILRRQDFESVTQEAYGDLKAFASKDPASQRNLEFIARTYTSYAAVLHYRLANYVYGLTLASADSASVVVYAGLISRRGKLLSGAEIHFGCEIGNRFVLDHGYGTVIGETTKIGHDCYILGGVVLGARSICNNSSGSRHPTLGDRVQVGAFASVLGPVSIGNDAMIGAHCLISEDVPAQHRVTLDGTENVVKSIRPGTRS